MSQADIITGDMREVLPTFIGLDADLILTDPPYCLESIAKRFGKEGAAPAQHGKDGAANRLSRGFMGADWDSKIAFDPETWAACMPVLKPGGRLLAFGGSRDFWRIAAAIDAAGYEQEDTISWVYGTGQVFRHSRMKPCWEPIVVFRRPGPRVLDLEIDEGRTSRGKWPGNLIHDGSSEVLAGLPEGAEAYFNECPFTEEEEIQRTLYSSKAGSKERVYHCRLCKENFPHRERAQHMHDQGHMDHVISHPTQKPLSLMAHLVKLFCPSEGVILDPFCGTGTTCLAAIQNGRDAIGIEQDPIFADHARQRIA